MNENINSMALSYPVAIPGTNKWALCTIINPESIHFEIIKQIRALNSEVIRLRDENQKLKGQLISEQTKGVINIGLMPFSRN
jgi:hypothetical protein